MAPTTFASAAASGPNANSPRTDASGDWSRRANGSTQTFRRSSAAVANSSSGFSREASSQNRNSTETVGVYIPPHRNGGLSEHRYSKEQLLSLYRNQQESGDLNHGLLSLFCPGWESELTNGAPSSPWARRDDQREVQTGADICWDSEGTTVPLTLRDPSAEEREIFSGSVNSPIKPPAQNTPKDGTPREASHRKTSVSGSLNSPGGYGLTSPTARPGTRRRDTNEAYPFPSAQNATGGMGRYSRDESHNMPNPPASLLRRRTDFGKESDRDDQEQEKSGKPDTTTSFGGLKRTVTGGISSNGAWGASPNSALSPMGGAFGSFAIGSPATASPSSKERSGFGSLRGESRFKTLMKETGDGDSSGLKEKRSLAGLGNSSEVHDSQNLRSKHAQTEASSADAGSSTALQGDDDFSPPRARAGGRIPGTNNKTSQDTLGMPMDTTQQTPQHRKTGALGEPMSPTDTNPYQSPENEKTEPTDLNVDISHPSLPGLGGFMQDSDSLPGFIGLGGLKASMPGESIDRSQNSSAGNRQGLSQLGALPGLGPSSAWSGQQPPTVGTPTRDRAAPFGSAFGEGIFSPVEQSAGLGFPAAGAFGGPSGFGSIGRGSRLQSLLPQSMHEQVRSQDPTAFGEPPLDFDRSQPGFGTFGRNAFGAGAIGTAPPRESESPFRSARGVFDEIASSGPAQDIPGQSTASPIIPSGGTPQQSNTRSGHGPQRQGSVNSTGSNQPSTPQVRTMVMPDRMKWVYKDPSGTVQGPWSGLEMNDWYKSGFFTPELLIRKVEDPDFEPLAHLIRRIGNSREPFLVPQIGVPHEPPPNARGWGGANAGGIQPPFPDSFPSFGTTLTADQQNALERRKQEEQFLMARQKEQLAQRQYAINMQHIHGQSHGSSGFPPLQHQQSTQSLHSQPSFGNIASPAGFAGPSGLSDNAFRSAPGASLSGLVPGLDVFPEDDPSGLVERLNIGHSNQGGPAAGPLGQAGGFDDPAHAHQVATMLNDRARLQREQADADALQQGQFDGEDDTAERLQQFHDLRAAEGLLSEGFADDYDLGTNNQEVDMTLEASRVNFTDEAQRDKQLEQSITQQVQMAVATKGSQPIAWNRVDPATMQPLIPPPTSSSPMPAPVAQRKQNVADTLAAGSRSPPQTPPVDTPSASVAPWAKEVVEPSKGPSLKEIQEAEAKKAAQQEELAAAARRANLAKELQAQQQAEAASTVQPGLPSTSNWASGAAAPSNSASVWAKASSSKAPTSASSKKTLQQIQKEEEARKRVVPPATSAATNSGGVQLLSSGKRYADLASKNAPAQAAVSAPTGAWTTVGAGGKVKTPIPAGPAVTARSTSGSVATLAQQAAAKPKQLARSTTLGSARLGQIDAQEEFKKWAVKELSSHLNKGINADLFVDGLLAIGLDSEILTEAVHSQSQTIDSRHFAEEFIRRRKMADKGVVAPDSTPAIPNSVAGASSGGWSEVAKKGPQLQESPSNFKVVAAKKKGGRR